MTVSAQELLRRHGIDYVATKSGKFTTNCPTCGQGYLNVTVDTEGAKWFCHHCDEGGGDRFEEAKPKNAAGVLGQPKAIYDYNDETGKLLFQVLRFEPVGQPKIFRQRTGPEQEKWSVKGVPQVPFKLPETLEEIAQGHTIFIVEGEKDVLALREQGVPATCNAGGAGKWRSDFNNIFVGADVVLCGDNDAPGREHIRKVATHLYGIASRLRVLDLAQFWPDIEPSDDISDWLSCHTVELLWQIVGDLPDYTPTAAQAGNGNGEVGARPAALAIMTMAQFMQDFVPPNYLINGMLQRRFIYSLTGQTGHAKTAVALLIARLVSCADPDALLGKHKVEKARVVYFVGENPDDVRMRLIGANAKRIEARREDDPTLDNLWFIPGQFNIAGMMHVLAEDFRRNGECGLIIVDTSAAFFLGNDEISNTQMGQYARTLRGLTTLPGGPCVLVLCHPIKHVIEPDQLLPRGGGAYLAEMDGNLTLWRKAEDEVELWHNKMRGPGFQAIAFRLETILTAALVDARGNQLPTVQAIAIDQFEEEQREEKRESDEDRVLTAMLRNEDGSTSTWAMDCGWYSAEKEPYKMRVSRIVERLSKQRPALTKKLRNRWVLSDEGKGVARKAALRFASGG